MPPPAAPGPDPERAVREQYDLAVKAGTPAALDLFIARHPGHPLAQKARDLVQRMKADGIPDGTDSAN
ncbi:hypothetical protein [Ancylobacter pratisalsi]|uniref:Uncharacterized protein n=1 Tax=Ancylobacter pratisalsi TaxID=1745854 RepID=A0A6P1YJL1_9HYPH|nr:hypothetical protein [Ancylobacter pratisalsi]QIB33342.1 hypothetical protein G3A50_06170 [Ancylobacter pratisalsi]